MKKLLLVLFCVTYSLAKSQTSCVYKTDTLLLNKKEVISYVECSIKKNYLFQFFTHNSKNYMRIVVKDNLGFDKTSSLLFYCGKKQIYIKSIKLQSIDRSSAFFMVELNPNYIATIKQLGISEMIFDETSSFSIPKSDSESIKKTLDCFVNKTAE